MFPLVQNCALGCLVHSAVVVWTLLCAIMTVVWLLMRLEHKSPHRGRCVARHWPQERTCDVISEASPKNHV